MDESNVDGNSSSGEWNPMIDEATFVSGYSTYDPVETFAGKGVQNYDPDAPPRLISGDVAYRLSADWESDRFDRAFDELLSETRPEFTHLVIGPWSPEMFDTQPTQVVEKICRHADKLPNLRALFFGDITQMDAEIFWIQQGDVSPLLTAFPQLEVFRTRGGQGLRLLANRHQKLRCLAIETGGMDVEVVRSIMTGAFPNLEHLELWLGTEEYGLTASVEDLQPLMTGQIFPKLRYLGLRNCDFTDDIAGVVVNAPIAERIETLDLSMGVLTDDGGQALLQLPQQGSLKHLNLHHHFLSDEMAQQLAGLPFAVDVSNQQDDEWRFVAIGE